MTHLHAALSPRLNLDFHQNAVPFLRELTVVNESEAPLQDLEITLVSDPPILKPRTWRIEAVGPGESYHFPTSMWPSTAPCWPDSPKPNAPRSPSP